MWQQVAHFKQQTVYYYMLYDKEKHYILKSDKQELTYVIYYI